MTRRSRAVWFFVALFATALLAPQMVGRVFSAIEVTERYLQEQAANQP